MVALSSAQAAALSVDAVAALSTDQVVALETTDLAALKTAQVAALTTDHIAALTSTQAAALKTAQIAALSVDQVAALTSPQVAALSTTQVTVFTADQIAAIGTAQIAAMTTTDFAALKTTQIAALTLEQIAALTTPQAFALKTAQVAALSVDQIVTLSTDTIAALVSTNIAALKLAQVAALTTDQIVALTTDDVAALKTTQMAVLSGEQVAALTTDQVVALTTAQVAALSLDQVAALTTDQIAAMETTDVAAFKVTQIAALSTDQIVALTTDEVVALKTTQFAAMTTEQLQALTMDQVAAMLPAQTNALTTTQQSYLNTVSPLILDLNGDGVQTLSYTAGVQFDLLANGRSVDTGWVSSSDGLLVLDRNHDGAITNGSELFGTATTLANGSKAPNGYAALRETDSNGDGVINSQDSIYADLRVWVDANSDGISQTGELKSLASAGVASISLQDTAALSKNNGNLIGLTSTYQSTDGSTRAAADVWFVADKNGSASAVATGSAATMALKPGASVTSMVAVASVDSAIAALNVSAAPKAGPLPYAALSSRATPVQAIGDTPVQASTDVLARPALQSLAFMPAPWGNREAAIATASVVPPAPAAAPSDIRASVSSLAQAIGSFESISAAAKEAGTVQTPDGRKPAQSAAALTVASMVDVMKGFDSNGNSLFATHSGAAALGKAITLPALQDPARNGVLASPS
jgi:hypothetical protein